MAAKSPRTGDLLAVNRRASQDYSVLERYEAGVALAGSEVKSIRAGHVTLSGGFAREEDGRLILCEVNIQPYEHGGHYNHSPTRPRQLLMRAREIRNLAQRLHQAGLSLVPLKLFKRRRWIKVELGLCRGRGRGDKREVLRQRDADRETRRAMARGASGARSRK